MKKNKPILLLLLTIIFGKAIAQVVPNVDWVQNYSERDQLENVPAAIDANNNVYTTGYTVYQGTRDYTTIKYDASGTQQWVAHYNNIVGGDDRSNAVVVDANGFIYVTGQSQGTGTGFDYATVKYNANGVQQWVARYNGPGNGDDIAVAIVVDNSGNVFVTGKSKGATSSDDYATVKYNSNGVQQWVSRYNGTANGDDNAVGIALGNGNRVFVTGTSRTSTTSNDIVTLRLNANNGNQNWVKFTNGTANNIDAAYTILADGNNVLVGGMVENTGTNQDYILIKINGNNSNTIFEKTYDGNGSSDFATSIAKDTQGDYVVTGTSRNASLIEYHTIKYNSSGVQQWVNKKSINQAFTQVSPKVATDFVDHIYVCGEINNANNIDVLLYQITPLGTGTWTETHNGTQNGNDVAVDLVMGNLGVIYLAAQTQNSNAKFDYTTIRYSQTPVVFPPDFNGENGDAAFTFFQNNGQLAYLDGQPANDVSLYTWGRQPNLFLEKGVFGFTYIKSDTIISTEDSVYRFNMAHTDANPNTKPFFFEDKGYYGSFILPHCPQGVSNVRGYSRIMIPNIYPNIDLHLYSNDEGLKYYYVVKPGGDPNRIGQLYSGVVSSQINGNGELEIDGGLETLTWDIPQAYQVNFALQNVPVNGAAWTQTATNQYKISVPTYNTSLPLIIQIDRGNQSRGAFPPIFNLGWSTYYGGPSNDRHNNVVTDATGNIFTVGSTSSAFLPGNLGFSNVAVLGDAFLTKYNNLGQIEFYSIFGGNGADYGRDVAFDPLNGEIYICGETGSNNLPVQNLVSSNHQSIYGGGQSDAFLMKYLSDGTNQIYSTYVGGVDNDAYYTMGIDQNTRSVYVAGMGSINTPIVNGGNGIHQGFGTGLVSRFTNSGLINETGLSGGSAKYYDMVEFENTYTTTTFDYTAFMLVGSSSALDGGTRVPNSIGNIGGSTNGILMPIYIDNSNQIMSTYGGTGTNPPRGTYFGGTNSETIWGVTFSNNLIYVVGETNSSPTTFPLQTSAFSNNYLDGASNNVFSEGFISRLNPEDLTNEWTDFIGKTDPLLPSGFSGTSIYDIQSGSGGKVYLTGTNNITNMVTVQPSNTYFNGTGSNGGLSFIMCFGPTDDLVWSTYFGGTGFVNPGPSGTSGNSIAIHQNTMYLVGNSFSPSDGITYDFPFADDGIAYFNPVMSGNEDAFISRLDLSSVSVLGVEDNNSTLANSSFMLYPNPTSNNFTIVSNNANGTNYEIKAYNTIGEIIFNDTFKNSLTINSSRWESGMYFITLSDGKNQWSQKIIKQ